MRVRVGGGLCVRAFMLTCARSMEDDKEMYMDDSDCDDMPPLIDGCAENDANEYWIPDYSGETT